MAQYKCMPYYEYIRPKVYVLFNANGDYFTNEDAVIKALDSASPFIQRIDKPEVKAEQLPEVKAKVIGGDGVKSEVIVAVGAKPDAESTVEKPEVIAPVKPKPSGKGRK